MSSSSITFNGTSTFSNDLQQVITRAVAIASLPISQLNQEKSRLQDQSNELGSIGTLLSRLQSSVENLQTSLGVSSLATSVSDGSIANAAVSSGAIPGSYSLEVTSLGAFANTISNAGLTAVSDPATQNITSDSSVTLSVNGEDTTITPHSQSLVSLADAINSRPELNVQASIVNVGSSASPDYRLTIQSTKLGLIPIELTDSSGRLTITLEPPGALATYKVSTLDSTITSDSRTITLSPGLTVNLLGQSTAGSPTKITVSQSSAAAGNGLAQFVTSYNAIVDELAKNHGSGHGALTGQSIVSVLEQTLHRIVNYSSSSASLGSLANLGIEFDKTGHLSFDQSAFSSATQGQLADLSAFLGDSDSGFLHDATDRLTDLADPITGLLGLVSGSVSALIAANETHTAAQQDRIDQLEASLTKQITAADATIASLQQQLSQITALFQAETTAAQAIHG